MVYNVKNMEKIIEILKSLTTGKFTGKIEITFNQGGIMGVNRFEIKKQKMI